MLSEKERLIIDIVNDMMDTISEVQMDKLKPCRQCGGEAKLYKYRTYIKVKGRLDYKYYVSCRACGHEEDDEGFGYLTEQEAINAWNTGGIIHSRRGGNG